jgi:hypothetical protein
MENWRKTGKKLQTCNLRNSKALTSLEPILRPRITTLAR